MKIDNDTNTLGDEITLNKDKNINTIYEKLFFSKIFW